MLFMWFNNIIKPIENYKDLLWLTILMTIHSEIGNS